MENKINIAEILRDMPKGTKLYSPLFGKCEYISVVDKKRCSLQQQRSITAASTTLKRCKLILLRFLNPCVRSSRSRRYW